MLLSFMLILVCFAQKRELWQEVTPISHCYAWLGSPCAAFVWAVYLIGLTANYGNRFAHHMSQGPGVRQPIVTLFMYFTWFSTPSGHLARDANIPNAHSRGGMSTYGAFFACLSHPLPKSKWHVPPPASGFAYGFYSQLRQSLCPPKGSKPSVRYGLPLSDSGYRRAVLMFLGG